MKEKSYSKILTEYPYNKQAKSKLYNKIVLYTCITSKQYTYKNSNKYEVLKFYNMETLLYLPLLHTGKFSVDEISRTTMYH